MKRADVVRYRAEWMSRLRATPSPRDIRQGRARTVVLGKAYTQVVQQRRLGRVRVRIRARVRARARARVRLRISVAWARVRVRAGAKGCAAGSPR